MYLLGCNLATSQTINTNLTKCYTQEQVSEIYNGLQQGEYLKTRLAKTEETLDKADLVVREQKDINLKLTRALSLSEQVTINNELAYQESKKILEYKIITLNNTIGINALKFKQDKRKALWKGIKIGGISVGILGTAAFFLLR